MFLCVEFVVTLCVKCVGTLRVEFVGTLCVEVMIVLLEDEGVGSDWQYPLIVIDLSVKKCIESCNRVDKVIEYEIYHI